LRIDLDQLRTNVDHPHARRHHGPGAQRKVDAVHARHVPVGEDGLLNPRALLRRQVHIAGLTRRGTARLSLTLLWSRGLTLLRRRLALLARSLTGGGIFRLLALVTLGLALLALVTVALLALAGLTGLSLAFLALLHLVLPSRTLACRLPALALACARLLRRTLLAFALARLRLGFMLLRLGFMLLRLPCRRLTLRLAALLRGILLALLLGTTLRLAGGALLVARARGAAFHLRAALGRGAAA
jgi:hypothetical protein